jgi:recombination protein RecR
VDYPSRSLETLIEALNRLPGIGRKTAFRLALHLLRAPEADNRVLGQAIAELQANTQYCATCGHLADSPLCRICANPRRHTGVICVVAEPQDLLAIERTGEYNGLYHVLGGVISPLEGIGPEQLRIQPLLTRAAAPETTEIIFALSTSLEADTTAFYLARKLAGLPLRLSHLARGIPVGSELEYTDELTLARSLLQRLPYGAGYGAENGSGVSNPPV